MQTRFPRGQASGSAPVNMWGWDAAGPSAGQKKKVYLSLYMKFVGSDYENQPVGTKLGFMGWGQSTSGAANQGYFLLNGVGSRAIQSSFTLRFVQQGYVARSLSANLGRSAAITAGVWHRIEVVFELNTVGAQNGVFKMWLDGNAIADYRNVVYVTPAYRNGFFSYKWNPTWGGMGSAVKTRDDYIQMDQVYLSGVP